MIFQNNSLIIILLLSTICCSSDNKIDDEFAIVDFNVNKNLLSDIPVIVDNILQITFPLDFNTIDANNFQKIKTAIDSDTNSFFQLSLLTVLNSSSGCSAILSKIISENYVFDELDSTYYNLLADNLKTDNIIKSKIKINGIKTVQYIIITPEIVIIKLIINKQELFYQFDFIIPLSNYEEKLRSIESSIGSIIDKKGG